MKIVTYLAYALSVLFVAIETSRRGLAYLSVNATTIIEDYLCSALLLAAAVLYTKRHAIAEKMMVAAWAYATGGMFVPFFAHLEANLRGVTFRADHPHAELEVIILKGVIWLVCVGCLIVSLRSSMSRA